MDVTVVICTRNRAASLDRVLHSVQALAAPATWELLVVDNGSDDETQAVIARHAQALPVRTVVEPTPGLSNARNRGIVEARGDWILWTDDDVQIAPGWLAGYVAALRRWPEAAVLGGRIIPVLEEPAPSWFRDSTDLLNLLLAARDFGDAPCRLSVESDMLPFGANFAVRTDVQRRHPYDPSLGVGPGMRRVGEETAVIRAILQAGDVGYWVPEAVVRHLIPHHRQTRAYIRQYYGAQGETLAHIEASESAAPRWRRALWHARPALSRSARYAVASLFGSPRVWVPHLINAAYHLGAAKHAWRTAGRRQPNKA